MSQAQIDTEATPIEAMPEAGTVHVRGSVTLDGAGEAREALLGAVHRHEGSKLVLELAGIEEIDTAGAAVLAEALKLGLNHGKHVLLCSPSESVMRIFRLAGFEDVLGHCCATAQETWQRLQD